MPNTEDYSNLDMKKECTKCGDGFLRCGYYNQYRNMINSDVVIATAKALILSKVPSVFDHRERTLLEVAVLYSDLVIVDEVDEIQKEFDSSFIDEIKIYSGSSVDNNYNRGDIESLLKIVHNIDRVNLSTKSKVKKYKENIRILDNIVNILIALFLDYGKQDFIREYIGINRNFSLISLIEEFAVKYAKKGEEKELRTVYYNFFTNDNILKDIFNKYFSKLENYDSEEINEETEESIEKICHYIAEALKKDINISLKVIRNGKRYSKEYKQTIRDNYIIFIMLIALIDYFYSYIRKGLKMIVPYVKDNKDNGLKDLVYRYLYKEDIPLVPESFLESFISGYRLSEENENDKRILVLRKSNYNGVGREVLFNITKNIPFLYNSKEVPMLIASATSIDTASSLYTIKHKVNRLLENDKQKKVEIMNLSRKEKLKMRNKINQQGVILKCHVFSDEKGVCYISGSSRDDEEENIERLINQLNDNLILDLIEDLKKYEEINGVKRGILITASSSRIANIIFDKLKVGNLSKKILWTPSFNEEFNSQKHIDKSNVEKISDFNIDILIAVNKSIGRGYNIMDSTGEKAYFRHVIIANRYLPSPSDNLTIVSYLHDYLTRQFMNKNKKGAKDFIKLKKEMGNIHIKLKYQETYYSKEEIIKDMIAGNMFADLSQLKGRAQRGGADCIIHLIDSKFYFETAKFAIKNPDIEVNQVIEKEEYFINGEPYLVDDSTSIFNKFKTILNRDKQLVSRLFDDMIEAFENHRLIVH